MAASARRRKAGFADATSEPYYAKASPTLLAGVPANANETEPSAQDQNDWLALYQHHESRFQSLYTWRLPWWTTWGQIARYMRYDRYYAFVTSNLYNQGLRQDYSIVDRTATLCGNVCAAGLMSGLTDPDRPWLQLGPAIPGFELDKQGQIWFDDLTERVRYIYDHSNFYDAQSTHFQDLVFFGNAPVIDYEDKDTIINVRTPCAGEYLLGNGFDYNDEVFYEEFRLTVSQIVEGFGIDNCPADIVRMWNQKGGALEYQHVIGHAIEPNFAVRGEDDERSVGKVEGGFTWRETYWIRGKKDTKPLSIAGFHEQPFAVSRWDVQSSEPYGRGIGEYMLADAIQLQLETRQKAESIEKVNRPPMGADVSLQNLPTSINPGKITFFNTANGGDKKFFPLYEVRPDIPAITADIAIVQERIARTAYNNIFRMMESLRDKTKGQLTATEVDTYKEEQLMQLGPVIGRAHGTLRQRVKRHLAIMARKGLIPRKPDSLRGVPLKIDFVSMLSAAQKSVSTAATARAFQFAGATSGAFPEARFVLDPIEGVKEFTEGVGAPKRIIRSAQEIKKLMQAEQQQKAASQLMAVTKEGAAAASSLSKTGVGPGSALSALVGNQS